jgi:uncharacterized membrane protein YqjE
MAATPEAASISPLDVLRILRSAGPALLTQAGLHGDLIRVEWAAEKERIVRLVAAAFIALVALLCVLLTVGALVLAFSWDTPYRAAVAAGLVIVYAAIAAIAWQRFKVHTSRGGEAFAATREELAEDMALIRSHL